MKIYCIGLKPDYNKVAVLEQAARKRGVPFEHIDPHTYNLALAPTLGRGDALIRASADGENWSVRAVESYLINDEVVTLFRNYRRALIVLRDSFFVHQKANIPIPKTIPVMTRQREVLAAYVAALGQFPVVLKVVGNSRGIGTMQVDSLPALYSLVDYLLAKGKHCVLRELIPIQPPVHSFRAVVLGDAIELVYKNASTDSHDFRSNARTAGRVREIVVIDPTFARELVRAVQVLELDFAAVDFLIKDNQLYVLEVNAPFNFIPIISELRYPLADRLIAHVVGKLENVVA